ncbi:hypothetical protein ABMY20_13860 [Tenacibaculum sp. SSH1-16]|uniref:hypothetical protein n=1 Tax=unclassified Tenacibaculum TaxID=2635139 RepID=UPI0012E6B4A9|nr:hypothetical protein [Tenacibaculum sp. XPcli2-G]MCO7184076.1 hypothetical protein [Tenacibaculum sp. XPcli2-G]BFF36232.1 hypothetical protein BACT7_10940 [Tenacibaculum mesophilum]GFD75466.1 hypothetical protein KUL113_48860 [Tenacibaculum sp. KUL113]
MQEKIYQKKKLLIIIGILIATLGGVMGYCTYENSPWETISGVISGIGFGLTFIALTIKSPTK